jgi:hypothetical protein
VAHVDGSNASYVPPFAGRRAEAPDLLRTRAAFRRKSRTMIVVKIIPDSSQTSWMDLMRQGEWEAAWRISDRELGKQSRQTHSYVPRHLQAIWDGRSLESKRVLVRCYHGLGDTVQFIRFMPQLREIASEVLVWCQPQLIPLLKTTRGIDCLLPLHDGAPEVEYDVDIELMEVPHALRITLNTLPHEVPYFDLQRSVPQSDDDHFRVGLVWQAGDWNQHRSISPRLLDSLLTIPNVSWQILQRGPALSAWSPPCAELPAIHGILDEALVMSNLDLLLSVDTLSAHLGGALGVPTWTLLPHEADWRWMDGRDDTPWYPTMRLFRQSHSGDWRDVITRVRALLEDKSRS